MIGQVSSNSLTESYQHTDSPFDFVKFSISNPKKSKGLSVCWYDSVNELELTWPITW